MDRTGFVSMSLGEPTRTIWGLCPACNNWQLDAPTDEHPLVLEIIFLEHDLEDHQGKLLKMAQGTRIRAAEGTLASRRGIYDPNRHDGYADMIGTADVTDAEEGY